MIIDLFLVVGAFIFYMVSLLLSGITLAMPQQFFDSIRYWFGFLDYLGGIFPVTDLKIALGFLVTLFGVKMLVKGIMWVISFTPGIHPHSPIK